MQLTWHVRRGDTAEDVLESNARLSGLAIMHQIDAGPDHGVAVCGLPDDAGRLIASHIIVVSPGFVLPVQSKDQAPAKTDPGML